MQKLATISPYALAELENVRDYLKLTDDAFDPMIVRLINAATAQIERRCRRPLKSRAFTEQVPGSGYDWLVVQNYPVTAVASAIHSFDGFVVSETVSTTGASFTDGGVITFPGLRTYLSGMYRVTYTAGFKVGTHDIELADLEEVCWRTVQVGWQDWRQSTGRAERLNIGNLAMDVARTAIPDDVKDKLEPFLRRV